jgi:uncharacterized protein DUF2490
MLRRRARALTPFRLALLLVFSSSLSRAHAQSNPLPPLQDTQLWADFAASHSLSEKTDFFVDGGLRWGRNVRELVYERLAAGLSIQPRSYLSLVPRYTFLDTEPTATQEVRENRLGFECTFTASLRRWTIADHNVIERRFRQPRDSTRYRNRLRLERPFKFSGSSFYGFVSDELYYDRAYHEWNRNRFLAGGGKTLGRELSVEVYYVRQKDYASRPNDLSGVGLMLRTRF